MSFVSNRKKLVSCLFWSLQFLGDFVTFAFDDSESRIPTHLGSVNIRCNLLLNDSRVIVLGCSFRAMPLCSSLNAWSSPSKVPVRTDQVMGKIFLDVEVLAEQACASGTLKNDLKYVVYLPVCLSLLFLSLSLCVSLSLSLSVCLYLSVCLSFSETTNIFSSFCH